MTEFSFTESWAAVLMAMLATGFWRILGLILSKRIASSGWLINLINAIAYAMVSGVMMLIIVFPSGVLSSSSLDHRLIGLFTAIAVMFFSNRIMISIFSGIGAFAISLTYL